MAGLTEKGLEIPTLTDVVTAYQVEAASVFSDLVSPGDIVDVTGESALGRIIGVVSPALADVYEAIQLVHDSFNPNAALGIALDNLIALSGLTRLAATPTRASVILEGDVNTAISSPQGKVYNSTTQRSFSILNPVILNTTAVSGVGLQVVTATAGATYTFSFTVDNVNYIDTSIVATASPTAASILAQLKTAIDSTLSASFDTSMRAGRLWVVRDDVFQTVTVTTSANLRVEKVQKLGLVVDDQVGPYPADALTITTISVPIIGWDSVSNPQAAVTGRLQETDAELRERFRNSKFIQSANIIEALLDDIQAVAGVTDVKIYENDTNSVDANGVQPHSFMPIVYGGLPTDIANAIWKNSPMGIASTGSTVISVVDSQGYTHSVGFQRPIETPIYMKLSISNTGALPGDAIAQLRQNLVDYGVKNYFIGDDLIYSRFYTPINSVPGHQVNSFTMGTTINPTGTSNIVIPFNGVATFNAANITITVV